MQRTLRTTVWLVVAVIILAIQAAPEAVGPGLSWLAGGIEAQARPGSGQAGAQPGGSVPPQARVFTSDVGMLVNYVKPDKTADFEAVIQKVKDALAKSGSPARKAQAAGWRVLKMTEPLANGNVVYVFLIDPVAKDADYSPSRILAEAFPDETVELFKRYQECFAGGVNLANYQIVADMK